MNNQIFSRLCNLMQGLGFSTAAGGITTAEMRAYAAGLSMIDELTESAFCNAFIDTADSYGVSMLLSLLALNPVQSMQENKQKIISAMSRGFQLPSKTNVFLEIYAKGFMVNTVSNKYTFVIGQSGYQKESFSNLGKLLKTCIPVYERLYRSGSSLDFDGLDSFGMNWFEIDETQLPFYAWDSLAGNNNI